MLRYLVSGAGAIHGKFPLRQYICKNTKNIQKSDFMDGFCWQGELDLTLFYKIEGYFDKLKSLMAENDQI